MEVRKKKKNSPTHSNMNVIKETKFTPKQPNTHRGIK